MKLIPVIDLKGGEVVAARLGERNAYAPLVSPLCASSRLDAVAAALLALHPFETLYIADLDAIARTGSHLDLIRSLKSAYPALELWLDTGLAGLEALPAGARPVIGSESLASLDELVALARRLASPLLSLDFRGDGLVGPAGLEHRYGLWSEEVILMTLTRVGSNAGPDFTLIERLRSVSPRKRLFAAGGVRDLEDLKRLRKIGAAGALVATALHQRRIGPSEIHSLQGG
jgi:phosphoribosylformimino-5-aminoimidazole carboxamide ribotide isomerase